MKTIFTALKIAITIIVVAFIAAMLAQYGLL